MPVTIQPAAPGDPEVARLVSAHEAEMRQRYGDDDPGPSLLSEVTFLLARRGERAVGCVALQPLAHASDGESGVGEIKRMFVEPSERGRGVGRALLAAAEDLARERGLRLLRLETGDAQPEALGLYASAGWARIAPYGYWRDSPSSVCFEKPTAS